METVAVVGDEFTDASVYCRWCRRWCRRWYSTDSEIVSLSIDVSTSRRRRRRRRQRRRRSAAPPHLPPTTHGTAAPYPHGSALPPRRPARTDPPRPQVVPRPIPDRAPWKAQERRDADGRAHEGTTVRTDGSGSGRRADRVPAEF